MQAIVGHTPAEEFCGKGKGLGALGWGWAFCFRGPWALGGVQRNPRSSRNRYTHKKAGLPMGGWSDGGHCVDQVSIYPIKKQAWSWTN